MHAKEEFGIDPDDLASPLLAGGSSFLAFALGALVPLLPYFLGATSILPGLLLTMVALFACGAVVTQVTVARLVVRRRPDDRSWGPPRPR